MKIGFDTEYQNGAQISGDRLSCAQINNRAAADKAAASVAAGGFLVSAGIAQDMPFASADKQPVTDLAANLSATDVELKTDYMAVMSLSMSDEDYSEMVRTGQMPDDMDAGDSVTILDDIKAALIKGGTIVAGYTDTIDADALASITGSQAAADELIRRMSEAGIDGSKLAESMAKQDLSVSAENVSQITNAVSLAREVLPLSDDTAAYLVNNDKAPTIENVYQAANAGAGDTSGGHRYYSEGGYVGRGSDLAHAEADMEALRPQIEDTIRRAGLDVTDDTYADARLLVSHDIPLTPETLLRLADLKDLRMEPDTGAITDAVSIALSAGISATAANLTYDESIYLRAEDIAQTVKAIPDEAADIVAAECEMLNIRNLQRAYNSMQLSGNSEQAPVTGIETSAQAGTESLTADQIHARRVLEEVRITMSVEANRMLLRTNTQIDIAPMEELVDTLKAAERAIASRLFPAEDEEVSASRMQMYTDAKSELSRIPAMPAAILGQYGTNGRLSFAAGETYTLHEVYETGSIRREAYIRAEESYEALMTAPRRDLGDSIRKAFSNVDDILKDLGLDVNDDNRRAVRILGYNSIEISAEKIEEVRSADLGLRNVLNRLTPERVLGMIREDINPLNMPIQELGDYLDGQDSDPERQAANYARFLMQLERQGEITELERVSYIGIYRMISKLDRTDDAAVGKLIEIGAQMSFANLLSAMRSTVRSGMDYTIDDTFAGADAQRVGAAIDEQISAAFTTGRFAESAGANETLIENLLLSGQKVSPDALDAMSALKNKRGDWFKPLTRTIMDADTDSVLDSMTDAESAQKAYSEMLDGAKARITDMIMEADRYVDVKALQTSVKQINILASVIKDETYDLPTEIDGELTSIRLTVKHESGAGKVAVSLTCVSIGAVAAEFSFRGSASGYIAYEQDEAYERLQSMLENLQEDLGFTPELVRTDRVDTDRYTDLIRNKEKEQNRIKDEDEASDINNIELYRVAKTFIAALRSI